jgi:hypothetical protein
VYKIIHFIQHNVDWFTITKYRCFHGFCEIETVSFSHDLSRPMAPYCGIAGGMNFPVNILCYIR